MPTGVLRFCLEYASKDEAAPGGVLTVVRERFADLAAGDLGELVGAAYDFRNNFIPHAKQELTDRTQAENGLKQWVVAIRALHEAAGHQAVADVV